MKVASPESSGVCNARVDCGKTNRERFASRFLLYKATKELGPWRPALGLNREVRCRMAALAKIKGPLGKHGNCRQLTLLDGSKRDSPDFAIAGRTADPFKTFRVGPMKGREALESGYSVEGVACARTVRSGNALRTRLSTLRGSSCLQRESPQSDHARRDMACRIPARKRLRATQGVTGPRAVSPQLPLD